MNHVPRLCLLSILKSCVQNVFSFLKDCTGPAEYCLNANAFSSGVLNEYDITKKLLKNNMCNIHVNLDHWFTESIWWKIRKTYFKRLLLNYMWRLIVIEFGSQSIDCEVHIKIFTFDMLDTSTAVPDCEKTLSVTRPRGSRTPRPPGFSHSRPRKAPRASQ